MSIDTLAADPRITIRRPGAPDLEGEAVVYWMQRAQRAVDNPALDVAIAAGNELGKPIVVFFGLNPFVAGANLRHYQFLAEGLHDIRAGLHRRGVGFVLRRYPFHRLVPFFDEVRPALIVGDENPLRQTERWREQIAESVLAPVWTVDADVVVPSNLLETEQYAARTIRPRIHQHLPAFLDRTSEPHPRKIWPLSRRLESLDASPHLLDDLPIDRSVSPVPSIRGGHEEGLRRLNAFVNTTLSQYDRDRNHPETSGTSVLSPYLHFGQLGPREVAEAVRQSGGPQPAVDAFLEQLIVRRELAVNFVKYNEAYDRLEGCEAWARETLRRHQHDPRSYQYDADELDAAATHDPLWNAAQRQMTTTGWMHGYLRMYWAKKILEWSVDAATALQTTIQLNDRYELDGRDPNGYANMAWAIGGKHDRPWPSRPIYGTIRSMSLASTSRKFDAAAYVEQHGSAEDLRCFHAGSPAATRRRSRESR
jgi:deoxyribodipyrimidine photo-lyase